MIGIKSRNFLFTFFMLGMLFLGSCGEKSKRGEKGEQIRESEGNEEEKSVKSTRTILFFGNSLTAGMGLEQDEAFPALIQKKIDSLNLDYEVINAGLSGETSAAGRNRIEWVLNQEIDIFVLELGANDGLRGIPVEETRENLQAIIDIVKEKDTETEIVLAGMQIPPNLGPEYTTNFRNLFPELAEKNEVHLIPFFLEDVAGNPELNQRDGIHPTAEGYKIVAENVWNVLEPIIADKL